MQDADRRLSIQNSKFEAQLAAVKERLDQARGASLSLFHPRQVSYSAGTCSIQGSGQHHDSLLWSYREATSWRRRCCRTATATCTGQLHSSVDIRRRRKPYLTNSERGRVSPFIPDTVAPFLTFAGFSPRLQWEWSVIFGNILENAFQLTTFSSSETSVLVLQLSVRQDRAGPGSCHTRRVLVQRQDSFSIFISSYVYTTVCIHNITTFFGPLTLTLVWVRARS